MNLNRSGVSLWRSLAAPPNYALHTTAKPLRGLASLAALGACELRRFRSSVMRLFVTTIASAFFCSAYASDPNPLLGSWKWNPVHGACPEIHTYRADGTAITESGSEILKKSYSVTPVAGGMYQLTQTVTATNGGKDCLGASTAIGKASSTFIQPLNSGGYLTCASEDGMSCYGSAVRKSTEK